MALVIIIDVIVVLGLAYLTVSKGLEKALPFFAFFCVLVPAESSIFLPGLFFLTTQRLAVVVLIVLYLAFGRRGPVEQKRFATPLKFLLALSLIWNIIAAANSIDPGMSAKQALSVLIEYYVVYYVFLRTVSTPESIEKIVTAMVYAIGVTTLFGAVESYTGWSVISWFPAGVYRFAAIGDDDSGGISLRTHSTFPHAILYGTALAMAIPQTLYLIVQAKSKAKKWLLWVICLLMFLCIYKTQSRGPWLAAIAGTALVFVLTHRKIRKYVLVVAALSAIVLIVRPGVYDTISALYSETFDPDHPKGASYEYRYALYGVAKKALAKSTSRALWGYGQESFYFLHLTGPFLGKADHAFESCDSTWIESMVETGYVGFGILVLLLGTAAWLSLRNVWRFQAPDKFLAWIFLVNLLQFYFLMASVALFSWGQTGYILWLIIALSLAYSKVLSVPTSEQAVARTGAAEALLVAGRRLSPEGAPLVRRRWEQIR